MSPAVCPRSSRPDGSAGFRAAPSSTGRLIVSASSKPEHAHRQAQQSRRVQIRLQQAAAAPDRGRPSSESATSPTPGTARCTRSTGDARGLLTISIIPGASTKKQQQIEVSHAPEPAEFEEERDAPQQRQEEPDFRTQTQVGHQRAVHGNLVSHDVRMGSGSPASWQSAFKAARCSASFLLRPHAGAYRRSPIRAEILKHFE